MKIESVYIKFCLVAVIDDEVLKLQCVLANHANTPLEPMKSKQVKYTRKEMFKIKSIL